MGRVLGADGHVGLLGRSEQVFRRSSTIRIRECDLQHILLVRIAGRRCPGSRPRVQSGSAGLAAISISSCRQVSRSAGTSPASNTRRKRVAGVATLRAPTTCPCRLCSAIPRALTPSSVPSKLAAKPLLRIDSSSRRKAGYSAAGMVSPPISALLLRKSWSIIGGDTIPADEYPAFL